MTQFRSTQDDDVLTRATAALQTGRVFIHPLASGITQSEANGLADLLRPDDGLYLAAIPDSATAETGGSLPKFAIQLASNIGGKLTLGVVTSNQIAGVSNTLPAGQAGQIAAQAASSGSPGSALAYFVQRVHQTQADQAAQAAKSPASSDSSDSSSVGPTIGWAAGSVVAVGITGFAWIHNRRNRLAREKASAQNPLLAAAESAEASLDADNQTSLDQIIELVSQLKQANENLTEDTKTDRQVRQALQQIGQDVNILVELLRSKPRQEVYVRANKLVHNLSSAVEIGRNYQRLKANPGYYLNADDYCREVAEALTNYAPRLRADIQSLNEGRLGDFRASLVDIKIASEPESSPKRLNL